MAQTGYLAGAKLADQTRGRADIRGCQRRAGRIIAIQHSAAIESDTIGNRWHTAINNYVTFWLQTCIRTRTPVLHQAKQGNKEVKKK